jgi:steroid delta-isomerase-like uncharacterized protein
VEATHKGEFMGVPATGKRLKVSGFTIGRIANGKIAEEWDLFDGLGLMQQLGVIPAKEIAESAPHAEHASHKSEKMMSAKQTVSANEIEKNKQLVRRYWEEFGEGISARLDEFFGEDYIDHQPDRELHGRDELKAFVTAILAAFPDSRVKLEDIIAEGDKVVTRWAMKGTHNGEFMGIAATGKPVKIAGLTISRIANGKIVEEWEMGDALGLMQQLGLIPKSQ